MTQRLGLAAALIHDPEVLLLDEPTDGVDPVGRSARSATCFAKRRSRATTILLNSHLLSEIELTCDRVAVLRAGKVAATGRIEELTRLGLALQAGAPAASTTRSWRRSARRAPGSSGSTGTSTSTARDLDHLNALVDRLRATRRHAPELSPLRIDPRGRLRRSGARRRCPRRRNRRALMRALAANIAGGLPRGGGALDAHRLLRALVALHPHLRGRRQPRHRRRRARRREALRPDRRPSATARSTSTSSSSGSSPASPAFLYVVGTFLAIFATAHLVPRLQEKGTIDLYLSRPVGRVALLLSRYAGGPAAGGRERRSTSSARSG